MATSLQGTLLRRGYSRGTLTPADVVADVLDRIDRRGEDGVWIHRLPRSEVLRQARDLPRRFSGRPLPPLYGLPFAVKDNIDVAGVPTTAACPEFAYVPRRSAEVVERVLAAGAVLVGKTNLDQFAAGLTGTRSPYGIVRNPFDDAFIAGGSSSGSAVAVSAGLCTFALGTDTAGSGRVPAGLTGTVGIKPSRGLVSTRGVVPACRSLDCPSVFALSASDGAAVLAVLAGHDPADHYARHLPLPPPRPARTRLDGVRVGVPAARAVAGDDAAGVMAGAVPRLAALGAEPVEVDLQPFVETGELLYGGPWIAERMAWLEDFVAARPDALHPVTREVLAGADRVRGVDVFRGLDALARARARTAPVWGAVDAILVPTAPITPRVDDVLADPIGVNTRLGRFTNFVNLLDLAAVAVPCVVGAGGVPAGVTLFGPSGTDALLADVGHVWQGACGLPLGATGEALVAEPS